MAINFPTSLDTFSNPTSSDLLDNATAALDHDVQHSNANDALEALEAKVGITSSAVNTSHDYKLSGVATGDKAVSKTGTETLTNKTLTSPVINVGSDATGDIYYRNSGGLYTRLAIGTSGNILSVSSGGIPEWISNPSAADASTTVKGVVEIATSAEIASGTSTGATGAKLVVPADAVAESGNDKVLKLTSAGKLPAIDGSLLTGLIASRITRVAGYNAADDTSENTVFTTTVTGGRLSANGLLRFRTAFEMINGATGGTYTIRLKYGGSTLSTIVITKNAVGGGSAVIFHGVLEGVIANNAATNAQNVGFYLVGGNELSGGANHIGIQGTTIPADTTSAIDTTANQTLAVTVQKSSGTIDGADTFFQTIVETIYNA